MPGFFHLVGKEAFDGQIENPATPGRPIIAVTRMIEEGDVVVAEGTVQVRKAAGGVLDAVFCDVFVMRDGLIARLTSYFMEVNAARDLRLERVEVYLCDTSGLDAAQLEACRRLLSTEERERHDRLLLPADRRDYAAAHALLRTVLAAHTGTPAERLEVRGRQAGAAVPAAGRGRRRGSRLQPGPLEGNGRVRRGRLGPAGDRRRGDLRVDRGRSVGGASLLVA
jgi:hypothetical protein